MKRLVLLLALFLGLFATAQKMTPEFLEGKWTSNGECSEMEFLLDNNNLNISETYISSNDSLKVINYKISNNNLFVETIFEYNNFKAYSRYVILDENTMMAYINNEIENSQVLYKRVLNNQTNF